LAGNANGWPRTIKLGPCLDPEVVKAAKSLGHKEMAALGLAEKEEAKD
jgi:hypothetical protein